MCSLPGRLPPSDKLAVLGANFRQEAHEEAEEAQVRVQDSHVGVRAFVAAAPTRGSPVAREAGRPDFAVLSQ